MIAHLVVDADIEEELGLVDAWHGEFGIRRLHLAELLHLLHLGVAVAACPGGKGPVGRLSHRACITARLVLVGIEGDWTDPVSGPSGGWSSPHPPLGWDQYTARPAKVLSPALTLIRRLVAVPKTRGGRSDAATHETARQVAASGIPVVTVPGSGHSFSEDDPEGFGRALLQLV